MLRPALEDRAKAEPHQFKLLAGCGGGTTSQSAQRLGDTTFIITLSQKVEAVDHCPATKHPSIEQASHGGVVCSDF